MAIKCHSSFAHYHMFHNSHSHGGNNYGSIFNITNNCNGGHMNFWGGLGAGLGYGLGGMFSGLFGGFMGGMGNMFSGFGNMFGGFGNMFGGFGMPMFGGFGGWGNGLAGLFGGGGYGAGGASDRDYSDYTPRRSRRSSSCDCGCKDNKKIKTKKEEFEDPDNKKIIDLRNKIRANDVTKEQLAQYVKDLNELKSKGLTDNYKHDKDVEELGIDALLAEADAKQKKLEEVEKQPVEDANKINIGGTPTDIDTIDSIEKLNSMTLEEAGKVSKDNAIKILDKLNLKNTDGTYKMSLTPAVLKLLEKAEVTVACANNSNSQDQWVKGKITNVQDNNGKLTYEIDCNGVTGAAYGYKYSFAQQDDKNGNKVFHLTQIDKNGSDKVGYIASNWSQRDYTWDNRKGHLVITGDPQISEHATGRKELTGKATDIKFS